MSAKKRGKSKTRSKKYKHSSCVTKRATAPNSAKKTNLVKSTLMENAILGYKRLILPYFKMILSDNKIIRTTVRVGLLYIASIILLGLFIKNINTRQTSSVNIVQSNAQVNNTIPAMIDSNIFSIEGQIIDSNEWHQAVQTAFSSRASAGLYQGGNLVDTSAINNNAFHLLADPIALQDIATKEGIMTKNLSPDSIRSLLIKQDSTSLQVSDSEVYQYYVTHPEQFARYAPQVHVREMVLPSNKVANHALSQLAEGTPFESLENKLDINDQFYKNKGGDVGWVTLGFSGLPPEWSANALRLTQPGQISPPFMMGTNYYYILQCVDSPDYEVAPFGTDTQERVKNDLLQSKSSDLLDVKIIAQETRFHIDVFDRKFVPIVTSFEQSL